ASFNTFPADFKVSFMRSSTMGLHPPQPVVALVAFATALTDSLPSSFTEQQICPLVTASQEQITAVSGKSSTLPKEAFFPPRLPKIKFSGFMGKGIALRYICNNML